MPNHETEWAAETRVTFTDAGLAAALEQKPVRRYKNRAWAVYDQEGALVCVTMYRKGAEEVYRRISAP